MLEDVLNPPTDAMKSLILEAAKEDGDRLQHNLNLLETWISFQSHLPKNYDKDLLVVFLRGCKHDLHCAKKKIERYFLTRTYDGVLFRNRIVSMDHDLRATAYGNYSPLPELTPEGYRITLRKLTTKDISVFKMLDCLRYDLMIYDIRLHHETLSSGEVYIYDTENVTALHAAKIITPELKKVIDYIQNAFPLRIKQIHIMTASSVVVNVVNLLKQLLSEKLASRIHFHKNWETLYEYVPQNLLPSEYGGGKKSCQKSTEDWKETLIEFDGWFRKLDDVKICGAVPKSLAESYSEYFGVEGSFRQLNID